MPPLMPPRGDFPCLLIEYQRVAWAFGPSAPADEREKGHVAAYQSVVAKADHPFCAVGTAWAISSALQFCRSDIQTGAVALVCGYPRSARAQKLMVMLQLQAFIDDSASEVGDRRLFLAGYINAAEQWAAFSDAWARELKRRPAIDYFKMTEAESLRGQFQDWSRPDRDKKVLALAHIISASSPWAVHCSVSREQYRRIVAPVAPWPLKNPYFSCFWGVIHLTAEYHGYPDAHGTPPVDFVFDEQAGIGEEAAMWYRWLKDEQDPSIRDLLGSTPIFRDDKKIVALQAADMLAWHIRRHHECGGTENRAAMDSLGAYGASRHINKAVLDGLARKFRRVPGVGNVQSKSSWRQTKKGFVAYRDAGLRPPKLNFTKMRLFNALFAVRRAINPLRYPRRTR